MTDPPHPRPSPAPARPGWVVFLGPTLRTEEARRILDARYLPPARRGDVWNLLAPGLTGIVLIDGVFHGQPAVWPRELLDALAGGVSIVGASSMGALRAAELAPFGMVGVGRVFEQYRDGALHGDDAVALLHGPAEARWAPLTLPRVNVDATVRAARARGVLTRREADEVEAAAAALHYQERTASALVEGRRSEGWPDGRLLVLRQLLGEALVDVKAGDALEALALVAAGEAPRPAPDPAHWAALPPRWRRDRLLRATFEGAPGVDLARRLGADPSFVGRAVLETLAHGWLALADMELAEAEVAERAEPEAADPEVEAEPAWADAAPRAAAAGPASSGGSGPPARGSDLLPGEADALARRRRRLERAVDGEEGDPAERLRRTASRWLEAVGAPPPAGGTDALGRCDPEAAGLPWVREVALLETWLADRLVGRPPWAA